MQLVDLYVEGLRQLPAVLKAASATQLSLAALMLILGVIVIAYLMKNAGVAWRFASLVLWSATALAVFGQVAGAGQKQVPSNPTEFVDVFSGRDQYVNHFMLGSRATVRGGSADLAGSIPIGFAPGRQRVWQSTPQCQHGTTDDFVLYASQKQPCMPEFGHLYALAEKAPQGRTLVNVWRGETSGVNKDLLYVNPNITPGTGYTLVGFIAR